MTLSKLPLGLDHGMVFVRICHMTVVYKLLTAKRGRIIRFYLCPILFRRFGTLDCPVLLEAWIKSLERLISAIIILYGLIASYVRNGEIICGICRVLVHLSVLFRTWVVLVVVLIDNILAEGRLMIVVVSNLLLRTGLIDGRIDVARLVSSLRGMLGRVKWFFIWWEDDILSFNHTYVLFCRRFRRLLNVALLRGAIIIIIIWSAYLVVSRPSIIVNWARWLRISYMRVMLAKLLPCIVHMLILHLLCRLLLRFALSRTVGNVLTSL